MHEDELQVHLNHFIEEIASLMEAEGLPRMVGRVFGYLLICTPRHQSSEQIADALHASRGSISTATRTLSQTGLLKRRRLPGDRSTYFEIPDDAADHLLHGAVARLLIFSKIIDNGLSLVEGEPDRDSARLKHFRDVYRFMGQEFPNLLARWDAQKEKS